MYKYFPISERIMSHVAHLKWQEGIATCFILKRRLHIFIRLSKVAFDNIRPVCYANPSISVTIKLVTQLASYKLNLGHKYVFNLRPLRGNTQARS